MSYWARNEHAHDAGRESCVTAPDVDQSHELELKCLPGYFTDFISASTPTFGILHAFLRVGTTCTLYHTNDSS